MSRISEAPDALRSSWQQPCLFCGERAERGGLWVGAGDAGQVAVHPWCAPKLGLLVADALIDQQPDHLPKHHAVELMLARFVAQVYRGLWYARLQAELHRRCRERGAPDV